MSLTKLQSTLSEIYDRIIIHREVFDPDQETFNFLLQAGQTPESETNQRYLQLVRTLRHEDYNVRSSAAKFLCMILFKNFNLQDRIRSLLPITILTTNLLVFNLPVMYNASVLSDLRRDMKEDKNPNRNEIFWHFPNHHYPNETLLTFDLLDPAIEEMLQLKLDPLYQFIGSLTAGKKPMTKQTKMKPGLLERKFSAHFSSPSLEPANRSLHISKSFRLQSTQGNDKSGEQSPNPREYVTLGSMSYRSGSKNFSPVSNKSVEIKYRKEGPSITITSDRSPDNSPTMQNSLIDSKTPKFSETRNFWMPSDYPGPNVSNQRRKIQKGASKKSFSTKNVSQAETNATTPAKSILLEKPSEEKFNKGTVTLLDLLEKSPNRTREMRLRRVRSRMEFQDYSDYSSPDNRSMSITRRQTRSFTNPRSNTSRTREFSTDYMEVSQSDMTRETLRLLKQDRHDMYRDYDKQVERMRLRPFDKTKFENMSHDPNNFPRKIAPPVAVDRKKAFVDFLNAGGKIGEKPAAQEKSGGIKGNTFHGRKWKSHMSKARLSNFGKKDEKYVLYLSPISSVVQTDKKNRTPVKERKELEVIKDHFEMDVAGSQQKYITNIMEFGQLDEKVYGESFKKYLDVLNYEKANYNLSDTTKLGEAYDLVNIIYEAKEKALHKHRAPTKPKEALPEEDGEEEEENQSIKVEKKDMSDPRFAKKVPRSRLFLRRRRSSAVSSEEKQPKNVPHLDYYSLMKGKKGISHEEVVRTSSSNSRTLHTEAQSLNATVKEGKFIKS